MHFKEKFNHIRPSHLYPIIYPSIDVPPWPAYTNCHAIQGHLTSLALNDVLSVRNVVLPENLFSQELISLGRSIGENREWTGSLYKIDTDAGQKLAENIWIIISSHQIEFDKLHTLITAAKSE